MAALSMTSAKVFAAPKAGVRPKARSMTVRAAGMSHGKGGEEGGAVLGNDAFGMVAKIASYSMFATAAQKVRRCPWHLRAPCRRRDTLTSVMCVCDDTLSP